MNMKNIGIIIGSEYRRRVRKKSFLLTTFLTPLLLGLCFLIPFGLMMADGNETYKVKVIDKSGIVAPYLENNDKLEYVVAESGETVEEIRNNLKGQGLYAVVEISAQDEKGDVSVSAFSDEPLSIEVKSDLSDVVNKSIEDYKLGFYNIDNLDSILKNVKSDIRINAMTVSDTGETKEDSVEIYMIIAYVAGLLIYMFVLLFGNSVMNSVIEEKSSRVVEVLVSSVKSVELMMGKIVGVALVALTQFTIWIVVCVAVVAGASTFVADKVLKDNGGMAAMTSMASGMPVGGGEGDVDIAALIESAGASQEATGALKVLNMIKEVNWIYLIGCFVIYFIMGYLLYASMYAAVGASVENASEASQLTLPVTIPLILGLFIMLFAFNHPSSPLAVWASIIPWTAPMVMLARVPFGTVPGWQIALSVVLLFATFVATAYLSARIYRSGILSYGKKSTFKDMFKWMKQK